MFEYKEKLIYTEGFLRLLNEEGEKGWQVIRIESARQRDGGWDAKMVLFMKEVDNGRSNKVSTECIQA